MIQNYFNAGSNIEGGRLSPQAVWSPLHTLTTFLGREHVQLLNDMSQSF